MSIAPHRSVANGLSALTSLELAGCKCIRESDLMTTFARFVELEDDEDALGVCQG